MLNKINKSKIRFVGNTLVAIFSLLVFLYVGISIVKTVTSSAQDFSVFYGSAHDILNHIDPYKDNKMFGPYLYPLGTLFFYLPFALLPYQIAQGLFVILSAISVFITVWFGWKTVSQKIPLSVYLVSVDLVFLSFPTKFTLGMGQVNLLAYMFLIVGWYLYSSKVLKNQPLSIVFFILAILVKPLLAFTLIFFVLRKQWQMLFAIMLGLACIMIAAGLLWGFDKYLYHLTHVLPHFAGYAGREIYYNQGTVGFVSRLFTDINTRIIFSNIINIGVLLSLVCIVWKYKVQDQILFSLLIIAIPLIDSLSWQHHFVVLIYPFIVVSFSIHKLLKQKHVNHPKLVSGALAISYLLISANIKNPSHFATFPVNLILSHVFYGAFLLYILAVFIVAKSQKNSS